MSPSQMLNCQALEELFLKGNPDLGLMPEKNLNLLLQGLVYGDNGVDMCHPVPGCSPKVLWARSAVLMGPC